MKELIIAFCTTLAVSSAMIIIYRDERVELANFSIPNRVMRPASNSDSVCQICKDMVKQARDQLESNETQQDLKAVFEGSCALLQIEAIVKECDKLVDQFIPQLIEYLAAQMDPSVVCSVSGLCELKEPVTDIQQVDNPGFIKEDDEDLPCQLCEQLVNHLRDLLVANTTETEFKQVLEGLCKQTNAFARECVGIVDKYYSDIYEFLTKNLNSAYICRMAGICPNPGNFQIDLEKDEIPLDILPTNEKLIKYNHCSSCEFIMNRLLIIRKHNARANIPFDMKIIKATLPGIKGHLNEINFLSEYEEMINELIKHGKKLSEICGLISVCPTKEFLQAWSEIPENYKQKVGARDKPNCPLCLFAITKLYELVENNKTVASIETALENLCNQLPKSLTSQCKDLVKDYSEKLILMYLKDFTPEEVCADLKLCNSSVSSKDRFLDTVSNESKYELCSINNLCSKNERPNCPLCLFAISQLYDLIKDDRTEKSIEAALEKLCVHLPKDLIKECENFVDLYSNEIIETIMAELTPQEVCIYLRLCNASRKNYELVGNEITRQKSNECSFCKYFFHYLDKIIGDKKSINDIDKALHSICRIMPKSLSVKCNNFVDEYVESIIELITQEVTPEEACIFLDFC